MEKRKEVLRVLKKFGRMPTSRIGANVGMSAGRVRVVLEQLHQLGQVKKTEETLATYWELPEKREVTECVF